MREGCSDERLSLIQPAGVELKLTFRDHNGQVLHTEQFWPHSIENIEPGETHAFEYNEELIGDFVLDAVKVVAVRHWD
jgi:hypothetical protein